MDTKKSENKAFGKSAIRRIMMSVLSMVLLVSISSSMAIPALSVTVDEETTSVSSNDTEVPESTVTEDNTTEPELTETPDEPTQDEGVDSEPENHSKKNYVLSKASPANGKCGTKATWSLNAEGVLTISGEGEMNSYSWNSAPWLNQRNSITKIVIEEGITLIGTAAFHATSVTEVEIASSVKQINYVAFYQCKSLNKVTFVDTEENPSQLLVLGQECFRECTALEEITLPNSINRVDSMAFQSCTSLRSANVPSSLSYVGEYMFRYCKALDSVEIPDTITKIGREAFNGTGITEINFPSNLTAIDYAAFYNCDSLTEVEIPDTVTTMGTQVFDNCDNLVKGNIPAGMTTVPASIYRNTKLSSIDLHDGITTICAEAFKNTQLTEVTIPNSVTVIESNAFSNNQLTEVQISDSVTTIGNSAFSDNQLTEVQIPDSVTNIGVNVFANNKLLEKINIPSTWTSIPNGFVSGCPLVSAIDMADGITSIGDSAFEGTAISELHIPDTVTKIGNKAFKNCDNLTEVQLPNGITEMGSEVFDDCNNIKKGNIPTGLTYVPAAIYRNTLISEITLHDGITDIGNGAFRYTKISEIEIPNTVTRIGEIAFADCSELWEVNIPDSVKTIGYAAFWNCTRFRDIYIPEGVETIGQEAFRYCNNLQTVIISDNVKTIAKGAFANCEQLRDINIPEGVETLGELVFSRDYTLKKVHLPNTLKTMGSEVFRECTRLKEVNIPTGISVINWGSFWDCDSLEYIEIPSNVTTIGESAFRHCNALKEVKLNEGIENIHNYVFYESFNLSKVNFPSTLQKIYRQAFQSTSLTEVKISDGLVLLDYAVFYNCDKLTEVELPDTITTMGTQVFDECDNLVKANFPSGMTYIPASTFRKTSVSEMTIPDGVTAIHEYAFNNSKLKEITIPESVVEIRHNAFNTSLLQKLVIPANAKTLGEAAFANNPNLEDVTFNYDVTEIPKNFFYNCGFREYTLPASVITLKEGAFNECKNLKKFTFPNDTNLTTLENNVFGSKMTYFYNVPANLNITASSFNNTNRAFGAKLNVIIDDASSSMTVKNKLMSGLIDTVTVDKTVTSVNASLITSFINDATTRLYFEPGAHFDLVGNVIIDDFRIISLYEGEYIADQNGVLYKIEDGKASLAYCPVDITTLVVPTRINDYEVIGVESNAVSSAANLKSITFQSPGNIKNLKNLSFAHAKNLETINGKNKDLEIVSLLGVSSMFDSEVINFRKLFEDTKIISTNVTHVNEDITLGTYDDKSEIPYVMIRTEHFKTSNTVLESDHPDFNYTMYTGQSETTTVVISPQGSTGYKYSLFFRFLDNYGRLNLSLGKNTFKTPAGNVYEVYVSKVDDTGYYRIDFPEMVPGDTLEVNIISDVTSPLSEGDTLLIWGEMYSPSDVAYTVPKTLPEHYQRVTWQTKPKEFSITANNYFPNTAVGFGWNGRDVTLRNGYYFAPTKITDIALDTIGSDYVRSIDYKFTISIPEGSEFKQEYIDAITNGKWKRAVLDGNTSNFYVEYNGTWAYIFSISTSGINSLDANGNGTLQPDITGATYNADTNSLSFNWNVANESEIQEIAQHYNTAFVNNDVIRLTDSFIDTVNESGQIANLAINTTWDQTIHYTYSADQKNTSSVDISYQIKPAQLRFTKTRSNWDTYMGYDRQFYLKAENLGMIPYKQLRHVEDTLNDVFCINTLDLYTMFMTDTYGKYLKVTVTNAVLEKLKGEKSQYTVMGTDGWTHQLNTYTTTSKNPEMTDEEYFTYKYGRGAVKDLNDHPDYTKDHTIVFTREGNNIVLTVDGKETYRCQTAQGLADLYEEIGYFVHRSDVYKVEWFMPESEWIFGDPLQWNVRFNVKSTFMLLNGDMECEHPYIGWRSNTASVYDNNEKLLSSATDSMEVRWGSYLGENDYVTYGLGNYTTLSTRVRFFNRRSQYEVMPLVHHIKGSALALVPAETTWNRSNKQLKGLEKYKYVEGNNTIWYYKLNKPGVYRNIAIGNQNWIADKVIVNVTDEGYEYYIWWYIAAYEWDGTVTIPIIYTSNYNSKLPSSPSGSKIPEISCAKIDEQTSGEGEYKIFRESWLNDHEFHRLYIGSGAGTAKIITGSKYIVTDRGEKPEDDALTDYSIVHANEKVTYRLSVKALGDISEKYVVTVHGRNLFDALPESSDVHQWEKGVNILDVQFIGEDGKPYTSINMDGQTINALENPDDWYLTYNGRDQLSSGANAPQYQWLTWGDDFRLRLYDETVYIYITLEMPDKSIWEDYADSIKGSSDYTIKNRLYVYQDTQNPHTNDEKDHVVTHELALQGEAMMNKGVVGTGFHAYTPDWNSADGWNEFNKTSSFFTQASDSRKYYVNDDYYRRDITYYISIYNSGKVRLYLDDIYDVLPKGFTFKGKINWSLTSKGTAFSRTNENSHLNTRNWDNYANIAVVQSESGKVANYKRGYIYADTEKLDDGRQKIVFHIRKNTWGYDEFSYDTRYDNKVFLNPGQALVFCYSCYTNKEEETEDYANSEVALKYFNYNDEGLRLSNGTVYGKDMFTSEKNDGKAYLLDDGQAKGHGFMDGNINTQWLYSEVAVRRGGIEPGITDFVDGIYHTDKAMVKADSNDFALFTDKITWRNTAYNDGNYTLTDYTLTNIMQGPFRYLDNIDLSYQYSGNYYNSRPDVRLMDITDWDENSSWVEFTYNGNTYKVDLDNEWHHVSYNSPTVNDEGEEVTEPSEQDYEVRITKDPITLDMKIDFRFIDKWWSIPEHGNVKLYCSTKVPQGDEWENKSFYNNAYITPNAQNFDERNVSKGIADIYTSIKEDQKAVKNSTQLPVSYGNSTSSYLKVEMTNNPNKSAYSTEDNNFIILPNSSKAITYTMSVTSQDRPLVQLIMINNLPQQDDHETFNQEIKRNSKFRVDFANEVSPFVKITEQDQTNGTLLDSSLYTVQYSDKVDFTKADWEGNNDGWYNEPRKTSRSIRYIILDDSGQLMKIKSRIDMGFNSVVVGEPTQGQFAWDTFGYHCTAYHTVVPQEAAPTNVGVGIPSIPFIEKKLTDEAGGSWNAEEDVNCRFVIYKNEEISGLSTLTNDEDIFNVLATANIPYTYCELTVKQGESQSESLSLNTMCYNYINGELTKTDEPFEWIQNEKYTVMELPLDDNNYAYGDISDSTGNVHTFTYVNSKQKYITARNKFKLWRIGIIKTDEEGHTLAGAAFGLYSPFEYDKLTDEQVQDLTAQLTPYSDGTVLFDKPIETEVELDGKTYYLKDIKESPENGTIVWGRLRMTEYAVTEIHAPEGYRRDTTFYIRQGKEFEVLSITVVNDKILGYKLPDSGGYVLYMYITGVFAAVIPTYMLYRKLRRRKGAIR